MKTTLEIPDVLFRRAKSAAVERGVPFRVIVAEALSEKLRSETAETKPWMKAFGKLRRFRKETAFVNRVVDKEFNTIQPEDWY